MNITSIRRLRRHVERATDDSRAKECEPPEPCEPPEGRDGEWVRIVGRNGFAIYLPAVEHEP